MAALAKRASVALTALVPVPDMQGGPQEQAVQGFINPRLFLLVNCRQGAESACVSSQFRVQEVSKCARRSKKSQKPRKICVSCVMFHKQKTLKNGAKPRKINQSLSKCSRRTGKSEARRATRGNSHSHLSPSRNETPAWCPAAVTQLL